VGVAITVATGLVHGRLTQRWGPTADLQAAAKRLMDLPAEMGQWQLTREVPIDERVTEILSCAGYINREYVNRQSGETVSIAITVGPSGPTAVHTPEICYSSRAYTIEDPAARVTLSDDEGRSHSFWSLTFRSNKPSTDRLRVWYAWQGGGVWTASGSPRFEFAGRPLLYKLQLASLISSAVTKHGKDPCGDFLSALLRSKWNSDAVNEAG
jgi:hypothetical protein